MTFKPGMHQLVAERNMDFDTIISKMAGVKAQAAAPMIGLGKRFFIQATCKKKGAKTVVDFFVELTFPGAPKNADTGYTAEEATIFRGVSIVDFEAEADKDGYHSNQGEIISYADFIARFITDEETIITLERVYEGMEAHLTVGERMLENMNAAWGNREPGDNNLYNLQYH